MRVAVLLSTAGPKDQRRPKNEHVNGRPAAAKLNTLLLNQSREEAGIVS